MRFKRALFLTMSLTAMFVTTSNRTASGQPQRKPHVLILGDSISIGYTPAVREMLSGEAVVVRPMTDLRRPENCAGTKKGVQHIDRWLKLGDGRWDVIHFNFGLHDLKRVNGETGAGSNNPLDPHQSPPETYAAQLSKIVARLKKTGAKLIFATTTPVPPGGVRPHRDVNDPSRYNTIARRIMRENKVAVNDLFVLTQSPLEGIQRPVNVHFTPEGSKILARQVVTHVRQALTDEPR